MLTFRSGGWVLVLAFLLVSAVIAWRMVAVVQQRTVPAIGDGETVDSYQFDLSTLRVPRHTLVASGLPRDGMRSLDSPAFMSAADADRYNREQRGKYLVSSDRVIGVVLEGEARAYPVRVLNWHEVVNDTVGGRPIAVTYSPLCDSAVVFDRTVGSEVLSFGFSGLLYNSNLVMYDRRPEGQTPSLWSQLEFRAVAGPSAAAGAMLRILPCALVQWSEWRRLHPDTQVLAPDSYYKSRYRRDPYANYFGTPEQLRFPVVPLPPEGLGPERKSPVVSIREGESWRVVPLADLADRVDVEGSTEVAIEGTDLRLVLRKNPLTAAVIHADGTPPPEVVYCFWFAWYAMHPDDADAQLVPADAFQ